MKSNGKIILSAFVILVMIFSNVSFVNGAEGPLSVSTFSELKANLENHEGSNIILSANIIIPSNLGLEQAILIEGGTHWSAPDLWSSFKVSPNRFYEAFRFSSDTSITFQTDLRNASVISRSSNVYV